MGSLLVPQKTERGWIIEVPTEMTDVMGVAEGSIAILNVKEGNLEIEILPPPTPELEESVQRIYAKYKDAFEEMKRLGD